MAEARSCLVLTLALSFVLSLVAEARAQEPDVGEGRAALPGLVHTRVAAERPRGVSVRGSAAYGFTESVGAAAGPHHRVAGTLGVSGQPLRWLGVGLAVDARADMHPNDLIPGAGGREAHGTLEVRATPDVGHGFTVGGAAMAILYGSLGGGLASKASSLELSGLCAYRRAGLLLAGELGYRVDRSDAVAPGQPLATSDRHSLGVSSFDAVLLRLSAKQAFGTHEAFVEYALDALVGSGAPGVSHSPMHLVGGMRQRLGSTMALDAYVDVGLSVRPAIPVAGPYVRIDPRVTVGLAFSYRFAVRADAPSSSEPIDASAANHDDVRSETEPTEPEVATPPQPRRIEGVVRDANDVPVVDAHVVLVLADGTTLEQFSDAEGRFLIEGIPPGAAELRIEAVGLETQTLALGDGELSLPRRGIRLVPAAASGTLRGTVVGFEGEAVAATITITPGDHATTVDAEGHFELTLEAGSYRVRIEAEGYAPQTREIRLTSGTVTILHIELRSRR